MSKLPVRDPFYSTFAVVAVTVLGIAAFAPAGSESEQASSQAVATAPLVAVYAKELPSPRVFNVANAEPVVASSAQ